MSSVREADACERIIVARDAAIGLSAIIAIHSTRRGPAFGGIRRRCYRDDDEARAEVIGLARAMSRKCALAGLAAGGGKTVVIAPPAGAPQPQWAAVYRALGSVIEQLHGRYVAGPDIGTGPAELVHVRRTTTHVNPPANDAGASTAAGVLVGLEAIFAMIDRPRPHVAIQGLGSVGGRIAAALRGDGLEVSGADPDPDACGRARAIGVRIVPPSAIVGSACDVLVPCATGGIFDRTSVAALRCRAICGAANEQLVDDAAAWALHRAGVIWAPDFVVNAGAVIEGVLTVQRGDDANVRRAIEATIDAIGPRLREILTRSQRDDRPAGLVAAALADARIHDHDAG